MSASMTETVQTWRNYRNCSTKQRLSLDWVTKRGRFEHDEGLSRFCLAGGAGGGGKSYNLRTAALEINMDLRDRGFPNAWGVLMCQTYNDLVGRHIGKLEEEFAGIGEVTSTKYRGLHLKFYGEGLGGVYLRNVVSSGDSKANKKDRRGIEYEYMLLDELTEFERDQFDKLLYNLRSGRALPYSALLAGTNPDGIGHAWVKGLWAPGNPAFRDWEDPMFKIIPHLGTSVMDPRSFFYVPILVEENPTYEENKEVWERNLSGIADPDIRRARRYGDWNIYASGRFSKIWNAGVHLFLWPDLLREMGVPLGITPEEFVADCERWGCEVYGSLDYGTADTSISAYLLHIVDRNDRLWTFAELPMVGKELEQQARMILNFEREWGVVPIMRYCDPALLGAAPEQKNDLSRIARFRDEGVDFFPGLNDRVAGAASCASALAWEKAIHPDLGEVWVRVPRARIHAGCKNLAGMIPNLARDPHNPEDVAKNDGKNHWYDSWRYIVHTRYQGINPLEELVVPHTRAWIRQLAERLREGRDDELVKHEKELWNESFRH